MMVVADSGAVYAALDRRDAWHERVRDWIASSREALLVPVTTLTEITYLLGVRCGPAAEERFVRDVASGEHVFEPLAAGDVLRAADLMHSYADLPLGFVDASIVAMAERLQVRDLLTTDRRHFGVVRPAHCERFKLLP